MSIALDIGAHRIRSLRRQGLRADATPRRPDHRAGASPRDPHRSVDFNPRESRDRLLARSCRAVYSILPDSAARRRLLEQTRTPYAVCEESLALMGDAAVETARLFQVPCIPLLKDGRLPHDDPPARQILAAMIEALLPQPTEANEICGLTIPGFPQSRRHTAHAVREQSSRHTPCAVRPHNRSVDSNPRDNRQHPELDFFTRLVQLRGYQPLILSGGMAVILAHAVTESFTGIGISFGATSCEVSLAHRGLEIARCSVPRGGDWIDQQLALNLDLYAWDVEGHRYLDTDAVANWKESLPRSVLDPSTARERLLEALYRELVAHVLQQAADEFAETPRVREIPQPLQVVCSGGAARVPGFGELLAEAAQTVAFPIALKGFQAAAASDYTIARGCLINAELEAETRKNEQFAA